MAKNNRPGCDTIFFSNLKKDNKAKISKNYILAGKLDLPINQIVDLSHYNFLTQLYQFLLESTAIRELAYIKAS